ncbi:50S ribosomal protein L25 [Sporolactobacillus sp. CPB3-1]|uniref:Large ribosomal subunit protein bL25 n=1 Tax=Sporolactobacillus mangiferae TaxID=2940498 RepID=A0ABT0MC65_9BACL|nr:50S ribosomal protein L25 [Sporolactobacillus mangiferae]MCL1632465.1 50S ribosomal protein L25 [Sporolactobacillus mangiferae]
MATINATIRREFKKSYAKQLRKEGKIPSVVYGKTVGNQSVAVEASAVNKLLNSEGRNAIINLDIEGEKKYTVMAHELQYDPIKGTVRHIDFLEINLNEDIDAVVPVVLKNAEQVETGDVVLNHQISELTVRALPNNLPSAIEVDVASLKVGEAIRVSDLATNNTEYKILGEPEDVIVTLSYGAKEAETTEEAADNAASEPAGENAAE